MKEINQVILIGRLTRKPEDRKVGEHKLVTFGLACGRDKEDCDFFEINAWNKLADHCIQYLNKGSQVLIQGRLRQERWEDKDTGKKMSRIIVLVNSIQFITKKSEQSNQKDEDGLPQNDLPSSKNEEETPF